MSRLPTWLDDDSVVEHHLGILKSGKEAQIDLHERVGPRGDRCLVAHKRYIPRAVKAKGELEALGLERASQFRNDVTYREGRQFRKTRDRRAIEQMTTYGRTLLQARWLGHEFDVMSILYEAGVQVPEPISFDEDRFVLEYVGARDGAAPQLAMARLDEHELASAWEQLVEGLHAITAAGWAHGDLSAYNLLWWDEHLWFIDFPQAVDIVVNPRGLDFLHRDVVNICGFFARKGVPGVDIDAEELFAELLGSIAGW